MSERDPRVDPKPGDVVIFGPQWQRERYEVMVRDAGVKYLMGDSRLGHHCSLRDWRQWSANAEIVKRGDA